MLCWAHQLIDTRSGKISGLEEMSTETSKSEMQRENTMKETEYLRNVQLKLQLQRV